MDNNKDNSSQANSCDEKQKVKKEDLQPEIDKKKQALNQQQPVKK